MNITVCDKGCSNQVPETTKLTYKLEKPYEVLDVETDWCEICIEKMTKRLAREAVHELRTPRPKKEELDDAIVNGTGAEQPLGYINYIAKCELQTPRPKKDNEK